MFRAKKSLGQNFLIDRNIINKIVNSSNIYGRSVLEIGPGTGNLTSAIIEKKPKKLFVIEKDDELCLLLSKNFEKQISIINNDILKFEEKKLTADKLIVFGNLPYNISTEILCKWITNLDEDDYWFDELILMFQKEVAERIIAKHDTSNYGRLSILSNWRLEIKKICDVSPNSFFPKPRVDSSILHFFPKKKFFKFRDSKNLEVITKIFFSNRRKMIKKPYNQIFNGNLQILEKLKINLNLRPQNLDLVTYINLVKEYENLKS